jgi:hypothetical protein
MRFKVLISFLLLASAAFALDANPKSLDYLKLRVIQGGSLDVTGSINVMNLTVYIPQEGVESMDVSADSWRIITDDFGNKVLLLEWEKPRGRIEYMVETVVNSNAKHLYGKYDSIGNDPSYLRETDTIVFNDDIRELAYPFEKSLEKAAELTILVNEIVEYDEGLAGDKKPSDWVLANKRGVCAEFSNLLTALLRVSSIPTRYVTGYSYSEIDKQFVGHAWVEVLLDNGNWVAFDPTWLEAGYLDATHVKIANLLDGNHTEALSYKGIGSIDWEKNSNEFEVIDHQTRSITSIALDSRDFARNEYGYLKADITAGECQISTIRVSSCVGDKGAKLFDVYDNKRTFFFCEREELYWVFDINAEDNAFYCPVVVYDQMGSRVEKRIKVQGIKYPGDVFISGPDTAGINEQFQLESSVEASDIIADFLFFSPELGKSSAKEWTLAIDNPGTYVFYLYSDGALAKKHVNVIEEKEFSLDLKIPDNVTSGGSFLAEVTIENLVNSNKQAVIRIEFDGQSEQKSLLFSPKETKKLNYNLSVSDAGLKKLTVSAMSNTIASHSASILVYEETSWLDDLFSGIASFFENIIRAVSELF